MAKIHDKFVIELAEVIKGYGNDPDVDDPFHLSEFYRFYELPEIAVSANHFKTMIPLEVVEKNAQPGWIPVTERLPEEETPVLICSTEKDKFYHSVAVGWYCDGEWHCWDDRYGKGEVEAWMSIPKPLEGGQE